MSALLGVVCVMLGAAALRWATFAHSPATIARRAAAGVTFGVAGVMLLAGCVHADSLDVVMQLPTAGKGVGCAPSAFVSVHEVQNWVVIALQGQAPAWRRGCEASVPCWDSVRVQTTPDTLARGWGAPGDTVRVRVWHPPGRWLVGVARNSRGWSCWRFIASSHP